jgi:hypothetical protein
MGLEQVRLKEGYYLTNFLSLINFVNKQYGDILKKDELLFIKKFKALPKDSARLYVRLISRSKNLFRLDKLNYLEIVDSKKAALNLASEGFLVFDGEWESEELISLFTKLELIGFLRTVSNKLKSSCSREEVLEEVLKNYEDEFYLWVKNSFHTLCPLGVDIESLFRLLFFGNLEQSLSEFILEDVGVLRFEKYRLTKKDRYFQNRKVVDETHELIQLQAQLYFAREEGEENLVDELMELVLKIRSKALSRKREKLCRMAGQFFEKQKKFVKALFYYNKSSLPPARERAVRVLSKLDRTDEALHLCKKMAKETFDDSEDEFLKHFPEKLKRDLGLDYKKAVRELFETEEFKVPHPKGEKIEPWSLKHLEKTGIKGFYVENYLWTSLFGLIFWDQIFKSKPGVFYNPFQRGPNDLYSEDFYLKRKSEIKKRLNWIGSIGWEKTILDTYSLKKETANHLVRWKQIKKSEVAKVLKRVPAEDMQAIMQRMSKSLRHHSSGFPDLFVYHPRKRDYCLVEIKGPGDQLQQSQKRWLRYFKEKNIPCKILKVFY